MNFNYGDVFRGEINVDELDRPWVVLLHQRKCLPHDEVYLDYNGGETDGVLFE